MSEVLKGVFRCWQGLMIILVNLDLKQIRQYHYNCFHVVDSLCKQFWPCMCHSVFTISMV